MTSADGRYEEVNDGDVGLEVGSLRFEEMIRARRGRKSWMKN